MMESGKVRNRVRGSERKDGEKKESVKVCGLETAVWERMK
ncbi:hypothetical protein FACS189472_18500 [Alphaproteobacteria bacterium]|nr:hypothetical protein FACS189472_18500 [Alphaproteobacteria bacterium]